MIFFQHFSSLSFIVFGTFSTSWTICILSVSNLVLWNALYPFWWEPQVVICETINHEQILFDIFPFRWSRTVSESETCVCVELSFPWQHDTLIDGSRRGLLWCLVSEDGACWPPLGASWGWQPPARGEHFHSPPPSPCYCDAMCREGRSSELPAFSCPSSTCHPACLCPGKSECQGESWITRWECWVFQNCLFNKQVKKIESAKESRLFDGYLL